MSDKEQFGVSMEEQLAQWRKKAEDATEQAHAKGGQFLESLRPELDKLGSQYEEARYKLSLLRMSSEDAWDELRHGFEKAFDEFKAGLGKALSKF